MSDRHTFQETFGSIAWYNGHIEWLQGLVDTLEKSGDGFIAVVLPTDEWFTDRHALFMFLVGMFGDWGTSIRSGWIEDKKAAIEFIKGAIERFTLEDEDV